MDYYNPNAAYQAAYGQAAYGQPEYGQTVYDKTAVAASVNSQTSSSAQAETSTAKEKEETRSYAATTLVVCTVVVFVILLSTVITLFASGFGSSYVTETTETNSPSIYAVRRGSVRVVPVLQTGSTPATTAIASTTAPQYSTAQDTTDFSELTPEPTTQPTTRPIITTTTTTATPTASTAAPAEMIDDQPLVCTMGIRTNSTQMFPPDGLCEYLFYDSLYKEGRNTFDAPDQFDTNLRTFVDIAPTYKTTAFGIGFSYNSAFHLQFYLRQQVTKKFNVMQHFWDHSIYHIGVLDSATVDPREVDIVPALNCLK